MVAFHAIRHDDPLTRDLLRLFSNFFTNCVELNLWLTRVVVDLCSCHFRSAEGWLLFKPEDGFIEDDDNNFVNTLVPEDHSGNQNLLSEFSEITTDLQSDSDDESIDFKPSSLDLAARKKPTFTRFPPLFTMLKTLRAQIAHYKSELFDEDLDGLLEERRRVLGFLDGISSAMNTTALQSSPRQTPYKPRGYVSPVATPSKPISSPSSSTSSIPLSTTQYNPFAQHFDRTRKLIQPLFPMGMDSMSPIQSPENSFADLNEVDTKRTTGEFEPPDEISLGRLLNNIIVFEVHLQKFMADWV
jgi:hypothetical protein